MWRKWRAVARRVSTAIAYKARQRRMMRQRAQTERVRKRIERVRRTTRIDWRER